MTTQNEIIRLRADAKHYRQLAAINRRMKREAKEAGDPVGALKAQCRVNEFVLAAQQRDGRARELRALLAA